MAKRRETVIVCHIYKAPASVEAAATLVKPIRGFLVSGRATGRYPVMARIDLTLACPPPLRPDSPAAANG